MALSSKRVFTLKYGVCDMRILYSDYSRKRPSDRSRRFESRGVSR